MACLQWVFRANDPCDVTRTSVRVFVTAVRPPLSYYSLVYLIFFLNFTNHLILFAEWWKTWNHYIKYQYFLKEYKLISDRPILLGFMLHLCDVMQLLRNSLGFILPLCDVMQLQHNSLGFMLPACYVVQLLHNSLGFMSPACDVVQLLHNSQQAGEQQCCSPAQWNCWILYINSSYIFY